MATPARLPLRPSLASERPPEPAPHPCFSAALAPQTHWHSQPGGARAHYADALRGAARCNYKPAASVRLALAVDGNRHCRHSCQHHASASPSAAIFALFLPLPSFPFFSFLSPLVSYLFRLVYLHNHNHHNHNRRALTFFSPFPLVNHAHHCYRAGWLSG